MSAESASPGRTAQLRSALADVNARIAAACAASGRDPAGVTLMVVTKTYPASDVAILAELGVHDIAENRDQEARVKAADLADEQRQWGFRWHMIGQLQRNKCASVAVWADVVESVDRLALVEPLARAAARRAGQLDVLVQVNLDPVPAPGRGGIPPEAALDLAAAIDAEPSLRLRGVMGVAPAKIPPMPDRADDPMSGIGVRDIAAAGFARLSAVSAQVRARWPEAVIMSAGMSGDLEAAIAAGSTQVRIGSAILGSRDAGR